MRPTLVVIDYAATSSSILPGLLVELSKNKHVKQPLRILMLERHADQQSGWFASLKDKSFTSREDVSLLFNPPEPVELALLSSLEHRHAILKSTLAAASTSTLHPGVTLPILPEPGANADFDRRLMAEQ